MGFEGRALTVRADRPIHDGVAIRIASFADSLRRACVRFRAAALVPAADAPRASTWSNVDRSQPVSDVSCRNDGTTMTGSFIQVAACVARTATARVRLTLVANIAAVLPCLGAERLRYETPDVVPSLSASKCARKSAAVHLWRGAWTLTYAIRLAFGATSRQRCMRFLRRLGVFRLRRSAAGTRRTYGRPTSATHVFSCQDEYPCLVWLRARLQARELALHGAKPTSAGR